MSSEQILKNLLVVLVVLLLFSPQVRAEEQNILILNSYNQNYEWTSKLEQGIINKLNSKEIIVHQEYMGTKLAADDIHFKNLYELYKHKYQSINLDLIIATDNHAFDFLLKNRNQLFGEIPVVFTGVNNFTLDMLEGHQNYYGVAEDINIEQTIDLAIELHPDAENITAIFSNSITGNKFKTIFENTIADYKISTNIYQLDNIEEVQNKLDQTSQNSVLFLGLILNDAQGNLLPVNQAMQKISNYTERPIYSFWEFYLGHGIVGGNLLSAQIKGEATADLALNVLAGQVEDHTIKEGQFSRYSFDYQELKEVGIEEALLPPNSRIIKQPTSIYYQYHDIIWGVIIAFIVLIALIIALIFYMNKYRRAITKLDYIFSETNLVFWSFDPQKEELIDISESCTELYGYSQADFFDNPDLLWEVAHNKDKALIKTKHQKIKDNSQLSSIGFEYRINIKTGEKLWVKEHNISFRDSSGDLTRIDGIIMDVTERKKAEQELLSYANYDHLTGVYNRRRGLVILEQNERIAMREELELTVCFIDINNLKFVNDNYGHEQGDEMIKMVVQVIESQVREIDNIIRLGGDEFLISFPNCSKKQAESIWQRIVEEFKKINQGSDFPYRIIVSHGIAQYSEVDTIENLINLADERMYQEKKELKNKYSVQKDIK
ncbi:MAG: ABC transporter substrate binding protein [Bacillota bacterium]